jgi:hypothetical protein
VVTTTTPGATSTPGVTSAAGVPSTSVAPSTTGTPATTGVTSPAGQKPAVETTTSLPPTTTTMNYCVENNGMNQPLTFNTSQVTSNPQPTTSLSNINPTTNSPGVNYSTMNPEINMTMSQPATLTVIYLPNDRPNQPSNVQQFIVQFIYPNGTKSDIMNSTIAPSPSSTTTSTPSTTGSSTTTTTPPSTTGFVLPSSASPQVNLPANFNVPSGTIVIIFITSTTDSQYPHSVCH